MVANVSEERRFWLLDPEEEAVLASETSVTVRHSSQRNIHEGLSLVKGTATATTGITTVTILLGSLSGGRQVGSEEMDSGLLLETSFAGFLKLMCNIWRAPKNVWFLTVSLLLWFAALFIVAKLATAIYFLPIVYGLSTNTDQTDCDEVSDCLLLESCRFKMLQLARLLSVPFLRPVNRRTITET